MSDPYRTIIVKLKQRRPNWIGVEAKNGWHSIPRSLLHAADDIKIDREGGIDEEIAIRVREWKAEQLGIA